ncbi:MAG: hypothetical protein PVH17_10665 [Anaerolineae bacterium]
MAYILLIILFSLFAIAPLLQPGYMWDAHDARHSVYFLFEFDRGIQDGIAYPRWQPDFAFGYGYPFFNIYGPFSTYVGEGVHLLGLGFADAIKMVFALSVIASGLAMFGFVRQVMGRRAGLVAAVAYMVIPYRLVDLYVRAALAESVAYVFVPLVLWGVWATLHRPRLVNILGLACAYAALMFASPLVTLLLTLILVFYIAALVLARINDEQPWRRFSRESLFPLAGHLGYILAPTAVALVLGLCLSAVFALPAMTENRFVRVDQWYGGRYAWGGDFVEFFQLFSPKWGFGTSVPGPKDDASFQLGLAPVVLSVLALAAWVGGRQSLSRRERERNSRALVGHVVSASGGGRREGEKWSRAPHLTARRLVLFFGALTVVVVFLMLDASAPLWQALPLVRLAQFPWRLLALTVVSMAFLCGAVVGVRSEQTFIDVPTLILVALLILGSLPYMRAEMSEREVSLAGLMRFQQSADEMTGSTAWVRQIPRWSPMADYHIAGEPLTSKIHYDYLYRQPGRVHARTLELHTDSELVEYSTERSVLLTFNTFYYPGWHAYLLDPETNAMIDELPIAVRGELGLMTVRVPAGVGRVLLRFQDTPIRKLGTAVTFGSLGLVIALLLGCLVLRVRKSREK